jgi:hypothetical protein
LFNPTDFEFGRARQVSGKIPRLKSPEHFVAIVGYGTPLAETKDSEGVIP